MEEKKITAACVKKPVYMDSLAPLFRARYIEKLKLIGGDDPYQIKDWSDDRKLLPGVTYPDILNYLIFVTSSYTIDDLKGYKNMDAYNWSQNGLVSHVKCIQYENKRLIKAKVLRSMRLREKPLIPWSFVQDDGVILASHCDCTADPEKVCSHTAAMLFYVMEIVLIRDTQTVAQDPANSKILSSIETVEYKEVRHIDFTSAKTLKRTPPVKAVRKRKHIPEPTSEEMNKFLSCLHASGRKVAILSVIEPYCKEYVPKFEKMVFPTVLTNMKDGNAMQMNYDQLLTHTDRIVLTMTDEEIDSVEAYTKGQAGGKMWDEVRAGRVTASKMKQVCTFGPASPSQSLILMSVCYPESKKLVTDATQWGAKQKKEALKKFIHAMNEHDNVRVEDCGLFISQEKPFIAASPDGIVECDCCRPCILEIKCPYTRRQKKLDTLIDNFFLVANEEGGVSLDHSHQYYFQVQAQLGVTKLKSAYFVVMTEVDMHIEKINFDADLWGIMCTRSEKFFKEAILPELVGKFYSRHPGCVPPNRALQASTKDKTECKNSKAEKNDVIVTM